MTWPQTPSLPFQMNFPYLATLKFMNCPFSLWTDQLGQCKARPLKFMGVSFFFCFLQCQVHSQKKMLNRSGVSTYTEILAFSTPTRGGKFLSLELLCRQSSACRLWWQANNDTIFFLLECALTDYASSFFLSYIDN